MDLPQISPSCWSTKLAPISHLPHLKKRDGLQTICLSVYMFICLSFHLSFYSTIYLMVRVCLSLSLSLSVNLLVGVSYHLAMSMPKIFSVCLPICLTDMSVCVVGFLCLCFYNSLVFY